MHIKKFPIEIIDRIIRFLPRETAYQCMFVCKSFNSPALFSFYNTINLEKIKSCLMDFDIIPKFQKYSNLVKTLEFGNYKIPKIPRDHSKGLSITRLFSNLPELRVVDLTNRTDSALILFALGSSLSRIDVDKEFMKDLNNIKVTIKSSSIEDDQVMAAYYSVCFKRRESITHMNVYRKQMNHIGYLSNYKNLTHVYMRNIGLTKAEDEKKDRLILSSVLRNCPNLVELEIFNKPDKSLVSVRDKYEYTVLPIPPTKDKIPTLTSYNKKMKSLKLTISCADISQMEYIMAYIPTFRLNEFSLCVLPHNTLEEWIKDKHAEIIVSKFAQHLSKTNRLRLRIDTKYPEGGEEVTGDDVFKVNTLLWSIARTIEDNQKINQCNIQLTLLDMPSEIPIHPHMNSASLLNACNLSFDIEIRNKNMRIHHRTQYSDFFHSKQNQNREKKFHNLLNPSSSFLSYWTPDRFIEDMAKRLEFRVPEYKLIKGITFAFINFPNIEYFDINNNANGNLEDIQRITFSKSNMWHITEKARIPLYKLHVRNALLEQPLIDRISFLLRYIREIVIDDIIIPDKKNRHNRIEMDFTRMNHIKEVTFNFPSILRRYSNTLIELNVNKNTACYKSGMKNGKHTFLEVSPLATTAQKGSVRIPPRVTIIIFLHHVTSIKFGTFDDMKFF